MTTQIFSAAYDGGEFRVEVQDGAVSFSEVPDIRTWSWSRAHEWLVVQGFKMRRVDSGRTTVELEFDAKRTQACC